MSGKRRRINIQQKKSPNMKWGHKRKKRRPWWLVALWSSLYTHILLPTFTHIIFGTITSFQSGAESKSAIILYHSTVNLFPRTECLISTAPTYLPASIICGKNHFISHRRTQNSYFSWGHRWKSRSINTYVYVNTFKYTHTYKIHTYVHTYIIDGKPDGKNIRVRKQVYVHTYILHAYVRTYKYTSIYKYIDDFTHTYIACANFGESDTREVLYTWCMYLCRSSWVLPMIVPVLWQTYWYVNRLMILSSWRP